MDEPWKDADTLANLYEGRTQGEVAEWLRERGHDVTGSTISYWMNKLSINTSHTKHDEGGVDEMSGKCVRCDGESPGPRNEICDKCLDEVRHNE